MAGLKKEIYDYGEETDLDGTEYFLIQNESRLTRRYSVSNIINFINNEKDYYTKKNSAVNGGFWRWDGGTTQTSSGYGAANNWRCEANGTTFENNRQDLPVGSEVRGRGLKYYSEHVVTSVAGTGNYYRYVIRIEDVLKYSGRTVPVLSTLRADSTKNIAVEGTAYFGDGGSAEITGITPQLIQINDIRDDYLVYLTFPDMSGIDLGTGDNFIEVVFWFDAGSDFDARAASLGQQSGTFEIADVRIDGFQDRSEEEENVECDWYYQMYGGQKSHTRYLIALGYDSSNAYGSLIFRTLMRTKPNIIYNGNLRLYDGVNTFPVTGIYQVDNLTFIDTWGGRIQSSGTITPNKVYQLTNNNDSSAFIAFDARLKKASE